MAAIKDGWHKVAGWEVYVEDGKVIRGIHRGDAVSVYPYFYSRYGGWDLCQTLTPDALRARLNRGTARMA